MSEGDNFYKWLNEMIGFASKTAFWYFVIIAVFFIILIIIGIFSQPWCS